MPACTLLYRATQKKLPARKADHVTGLEGKDEEDEENRPFEWEDRRADVSRLSKTLFSVDNSLHSIFAR